MIKSLILNSIVVFPLKDDAFKLPNKSTLRYDLIEDSGILNPNNFEFIEIGVDKCLPKLINWSGFVGKLRIEKSGSGKPIPNGANSRKIP